MSTKEQSTINIQEVASTFRKPSYEFFIHASSSNPQELLFFQVSYLTERIVAGQKYMSTLAVTPDPSETRSQEMKRTTMESYTGNFLLIPPADATNVEVRVVNRDGAVATKTFTVDELKDMEWDKAHAPETEMISETVEGEPELVVTREGDSLVVELKNCPKQFKHRLNSVGIYALDSKNTMVFFKRNGDGKWLGNISTLDHGEKITIQVDTTIDSPFFNKTETLEPVR